MTEQAALEIWREGNAAALEAIGYVMDADLCRRGQFDLMPSAKAFQEVIAKAIEARRAETQSGSVHESADPQGVCPKDGM